MRVKFLFFQNARFKIKARVSHYIDRKLDTLDNDAEGNHFNFIVGLTIKVAEINFTFLFVFQKSF